MKIIETLREFDGYCDIVLPLGGNMGKKVFTFSVITVLALGSLSAQNLPADKLNESLIRLESHMKSIHDEAEFNRYLSSGFLVGTGALIGGGGYVLVNNIIPESSTEFRNSAYAIVGVYAGLLIVPGVLIYAILPEAERMPNDFIKLPSLMDSEKQKKVIQGELMLKTLSDHSYMNRMINGIIYLAAGGGQLAYYYYGPASEYPSAYTASTYQSFVYSGCTMAGLGLITLLIKSKSETDYETYMDWKDGVSRKKSLLDIFDFGMGVSPKGEPMVMAKLSF
jgi:hypothetical protein